MTEAYMKYTGSMHTTKFLYPKTLKKYVEVAIKVLTPIKKQFDTIAFCGMSGALVAPLIAIALNKELIMVRKASDKCNSPYRVEGNLQKVKKYIIVDDFIDSGKTWKHIKRKIRSATIDNSYEATCMGLLAVQELEGTGSFYKRTGLIDVGE